MVRGLEFKQLNPHSCWTYLVGMKDSKDVVLIDPVLDHLNDYLDLIERDKLTLVLVVDTHTHADHISAGPSLKDHTHCDYAMHKKAVSQWKDRKLLEFQIF